MCVVSCPIICDYGVAVSRASTPPRVFGSAVLYRCSEETMTIKRRKPDQQRASVSEQLVTESGDYSRGQTQPERSRAASQRVQATAEFVALRRRPYHVTATSRGRRTPVFRRPRRRTRPLVGPSSTGTAVSVAEEQYLGVLRADNVVGLKSQGSTAIRTRGVVLYKLPCVLCCVRDLLYVYTHPVYIR